MSDGATYVHPELVNLAAKLDEKELTAIANECMEGYKEDVQSRTEWDMMHEDWVNIFYQKDKPINPPWTGSSTESLPLLAEACTQYSARAKQALFPAREFIKVIPTGKVDAEAKERAERVQTHLVWQCMVLNKRTYKRDKFRLLLGHSLHGSYFTKTWWNPVKSKWVCENVPPDCLVVNYGTGPRDIEDVERKTQIIPLSLNRTRILASKGYFLTEFEPYQGDITGVQKAQNEAQGTSEPYRLDDRNCLALEQHTFLDLDKDGIAEPYIVTLDAQAEKVQRISIRYDVDEIGRPLDNKEPVEYFTHYPYIENPGGFYGLGMGHLIANINKSANKMLRQTVDAGSLQTILAMSGFLSSTVNIQGGQIEMVLGKFVKTTASGEELQKGVWQPKVQPISPVLREMMELLMARSDRVASATEALTGQTDKVMQPTAIMALVMPCPMTSTTRMPACSGSMRVMPK